MRRIALVLLLLVGPVALPAVASPVVPPPSLGLMNADGTNQRFVRDGVYGYGWGGASWSPDSTRLVVDGLTVFDASTGEGVFLTEGRIPDWSPTDDQIAFGRPIYGETYDAEISLIDARGGDGRSLVNTPLFDTAPAWSPDGQQVAFVSTPLNGGPGTVNMIDRDGSNLTPLPSQRALQTTPEWSPDGDRIVYDTSEGRLRVIDLVAKTDDELTSFEHASQATWCPDGTLYFTGQPEPDALHGIYSLQPGTSPTFVTRGASPDCRADGKIAFSRGGDIYVIDPGTEGTPNLTESPGRTDSEPRWSPDATMIAWSSQEEIPPARRVERDITLSLRRHLVARGSVGSSLADEPCPAEIRVQKLRASGWRTVKTVGVGYEKGFRTRLPDRAGYYRAVAPRSWSTWGEVVCLRAVSSIARHRH